jgi:hypothetical protein
LSPRIDHRPPVIAFLVLVVLAIAVIGTNARAVDRLVVAGEPLVVHARVSGTALRPEPAAVPVAATERLRPVSRTAPRSGEVHNRATARPAVTPQPHRRTTSARSVRAHGRHLDPAHGRALLPGLLFRGYAPLGRALGLP